ncbi:hypothetical protein AC579_9133 [Pseudocercospora musae]|uniref:Uncharacterized protein n=1 Tax=Pseudocercospora musae TaxID=113226 RepID=A0A139IIU8_9PEZI|nr:hypothetical protein AC579_9133 [Pseudocercospora musae]
MHWKNKVTVYMRFDHVNDAEQAQIDVSMVNQRWVVKNVTQTDRLRGDQRRVFGKHRMRGFDTGYRSRYDENAWLHQTNSVEKYSTLGWLYRDDGVY